MTANQALRLLHDDRQGPPLFWNGGGSAPLWVCIPARVMREVIGLSLRGLPEPYPGGEQAGQSREVLGIFLGMSLELGGRKLVIVQRMVPMDIRENFQPDYCEYRAEDKARVDHIISKSGLSVFKEVGWFHTHPEHPIFLSPPDQKLMRSHFSQDDQFALVVKPKEGLGGIFVWDDGELDHSEEDVGRRGGVLSLRGYFTHQAWQAMIEMGAVNPDQHTDAPSAHGANASWGEFEGELRSSVDAESTFIPRSGRGLPGAVKDAQGSSTQAPAATGSPSSKTQLLLILIIAQALILGVLSYIVLTKGSKGQAAQPSKRVPPRVITRQVTPRAQMPNRRAPLFVPSERIAPIRRRSVGTTKRKWCLRVEVSLQSNTKQQELQQARSLVRSLLRQETRMRPYCSLSGAGSMRDISCRIRSRQKPRWNKSSFRRRLDSQYALRGYVLSARLCQACSCR